LDGQKRLLKNQGGPRIPKTRKTKQKETKKMTAPSEEIMRTLSSVLSEALENNRNWENNSNFNTYADEKFFCRKEARELATAWNWLDTVIQESKSSQE
jgi:hypothetical protein